MTLMAVMASDSFAQQSLIEKCEDAGSRRLVVLALAEKSSLGVRVLPGVSKDKETYLELGKTLGMETTLITDDDIVEKFATDSEHREYDRLWAQFHAANDRVSKKRDELYLAQRRKKPRAVIVKLRTELQSLEDKAEATRIEINEFSSRLLPRGELVKQKLREARDKIVREDPSAEIVFAFSGHGTNCADSGRPDEVGWCIYVQRGVLISDREIFDILKPSGMILDSCFSGRIEQRLGTIHAKDSFAGTDGVFLFASAHAQQIATDTQSGGILTNALQNMMNASSEQICGMDMDQDGQISEREVAVAMLMGFYNRTTASNAAFYGRPRGLIDLGDEYKHRSFSDRGQTPVSVVRDRCMFKVSPQAGCSINNGPRSGAGHDSRNSCVDHLGRLTAMVSNLDDFKFPPAERTLKRFSFLYTPHDKPAGGRGGGSSAIEFPIDDLQPLADFKPDPEEDARWALAGRQSKLFIDQWRAEIEERTRACQAGMNPDECKAWDGVTNSVDELFRRLYIYGTQIVLQSRAYY